MVGRIGAADLPSLLNSRSAILGSQKASFEQITFSLNKFISIVLRSWPMDSPARLLGARFTHSFFGNYLPRCCKMTNWQSIGKIGAK